MSSTYNTLSGDNYYDQSGLHNEIGAGLLNYEKMREAMNNYVSITRARNSSIEDLDDTGETLEFTASKNQGSKSLEKKDQKAGGQSRA